MRTLFVLTISFFVFSLTAQQKQKQNAPFTIRGTVGIPKTVSSRLFSTAFKGVVEANLSANARIFKNVFAGLGYQNSFFQNNKDIFINQVTAKASVPYDTKLMLNSVFLKIGYDYFFSDKGYVTCALNAGYSFANYSKILSDTSKANMPFVGPKFSAPFIQPEFSINFLTDDEALINFSLMIAYNNLLYQFNPKAPRLCQFKPMSEFYQQNRNSYWMSWINIGFGFNVLIK